MITRMIKRRALRLIERRDPDFIIGPQDDPYMLRWWWLPRNKIFNVYVHVFRHDDDDRALHDHPWWNVSILLRGELAEARKTKRGNKYRLFTRFVPIFRTAKASHRLILPNTVKQNKGAWTIFITGPRIREWGFHCPKGWVHWKDFVAENPGEVGRGCGE